MSVFDGVPADLLGFFTEHEKEMIDQYWQATERLVSGEVVAENDKQERLLQVDSGLLRPTSGFEVAWVRFKALKDALAVRRQMTQRLSEMEDAVRKAQEDAIRIDINAKAKYKHLLDEKAAVLATIEDFKDQVKYFNGLYEVTHDELQEAIGHAALHEKDRDYEINALLIELDRVYAKIRRYEMDNGMFYTQPDRFTRLDPKGIPVVTYEPMPPAESSTMSSRCEACGRPISFCACAN